MKSRVVQVEFDDEVLKEMDKFAEAFLSNEYKKDTSVNKGPNYREIIMHEDQMGFFEYLESDFSDDFLNLQ